MSRVSIGLVFFCVVMSPVVIKAIPVVVIFSAATFNGGGGGCMGSVPLGYITPVGIGEVTRPGLTRFEALDVYVDSGSNSLAAYQFELSASSGNVQIVGVEGGEHSAFREPPFYDPVALNQNRIIVAAFSTADSLPDGKTRIARIHVQRDDDGNEPDYTATLSVAAAPDGATITSEISVVVAQGDSQ